MGDSIYISNDFWDEVWPGYERKLKKKQSWVTYRRELNQICDYLKKNFNEISDQDAYRYHGYLQQQIKNGSYNKRTVNLKISILHSIAQWYRKNVDDSNENPFSSIYSIEDFSLKAPSRVEVSFIGKKMEQMDIMKGVFLLISRCGAKMPEIENMLIGDIKVYEDGINVKIGKGIRYREVELSREEGVMFVSFMQNGQADRKLFLGKYGKPAQIRTFQRYYRDCVGEEYPYTLNDLRNASIAIALADCKDEKKVMREMAINENWIDMYIELAKNYNWHARTYRDL